MTDSQAPVEQCPACGSVSVSYWEALETWICDDCSCVVETTDNLEVQPTMSDEFSGSTEEDAAINWSEAISVRDKSEANLVEVLSTAESVADELSLSKEITIRSGEIVVDAWKTNFMHGRTKPDTIGAALYAASREFGNSVPPAMVTDTLETDKQSLKETYQQLKRELELDIDPPRPEEYVTHLCRVLGFSGDLERAALEVLEEGETGNGNPIGIAGASIYVASLGKDENITLRRIASVTGMTKETIWRQVSDIDYKI